MNIWQRTTMAISIILIGVTQNAIAQPQDDKLIVRTYYYALTMFRESPFSDPRGVRPITKMQAKNKNHHAFGYDEQGRLREVEFRLGDRLRPTDNVYLESFFWLTTGVTYDYEDHREIRRFYNHRGEATTMRGAYREIFELDGRGWRKNLTFENAAGEAIENDWGIARYEWQVEQDGTVLESRTNLAGEKVAMRPNLPFFDIRLNYGPNDMLARMDNYGLDGRLQNNDLNAAMDVLEYDEEGSFRAWNVYDENGERAVGNTPQVARAVQTGFPGAFGEGAYETKYYNVDGAPMNNYQGIHRSRTKFDKRGNIIEQSTFDLNEEPVGSQETFGVPSIKLEWSDNGLYVTTTVLYDANGEPATLPGGGHRIERTYDDSGRITMQRLVGADGKPVLFPGSNVATRLSTYDKDGQQSDKFLGADGNEVEPAR